MMSVNLGEEGATLVEVVIAVAMISAAVVVISLVFPNASKDLSNNRFRFLASNFASALIQQTKEQTYSLLAPTPPGPYFGVTQCDCRQVDFSGLSPEAIYSEDSVSYTRKICINLVAYVSGGGWTSYCPDTPLTSATDHGIKNIQVRVGWTVGNTAYSTQMESMVTR